MTESEAADSRTWIITGCSTGIGREVARAALEAGDHVALTARDPATLSALTEAFPERARALRLDVTQPDQVVAAVADAQAAFGRIDVLVNNAGYGYVGAVEEGVEADVRAMFDTNFFGAIAMIKAVLPGMRARRAGYIMNMTSITGFVANPGNVYYSASKFALESLSEGLRKELAPLGIRVTAVAPGFFRTDWASRSMQESAAQIADYEETAGARRRLMREGAADAGGDPRRIAEVVVELSRRADPPLHVLLGPDIYGAVRAKLDELSSSIELWKEASLGGALPPERPT